MAKKRTKIKIVLRPLGNEKAWGLAFISDRVIHLDERVRPKMLMVNALHEVGHCLNPLASEAKVEKDAQIMTDVLWRLGFRLIYPENKRIKPFPKKSKKKNKNV